MRPEQAAKAFPILGGFVAAVVAAVALVIRDYRLAGSAGVCVALAIGTGIWIRVQIDAENRPPDDQV